MAKFNSLLILLMLAPLALGQDDKPAEPRGADNIAAEDALKGDRDMAGRFASLAQETLRQKVVLPPHFRQASSLLMTAMKLDPQEARYPRMLYEAMLQLGDARGALEALRTYRQLAPNDQGAAIAFIDLRIRQEEDAGARLGYLDAVMKAEPSRVPSEVRGHAAMRAAQIARERGDTSQEQVLLAQAIRLNPLNLEALRRKLELQETDGTVAERMGTMLQMLRSNPVQPAILYRIAREVADAGLFQESLDYYRMTVNVASAAGVPMGREFAIGYASELYLMGQPQLLDAVRGITAQLVKAEPGDVEAQLLRVLTERAGEEPAAAAKIHPQLINAALNRLITVREQMEVKGGPATRPVESTEAVVLPDVSDDVKKLQEEKYVPLQASYALALADLTWYLVYIDHKPAEAARLLPGLKAVLGETNPVAVRIEGFIALAQNQLDQAKIKLEAVAEQDGLAQMGLLLLQAKDPAQKDKAMGLARKLMAQNPSGLFAAVLMDGLKPLKARVMERADAAAIREVLGGFKGDWLRIVAAPQTFYALKADMVDGRVRFGFGQPMMVNVVIRNIGPFDITIGSEGVIKSDLWFDAQFRGLVQQTVTGAAYDRIAGPLVLKAGQSMSQVVRLDQGQLATVLSGNPQPVLTFYGQIRTNPRGEGGSSPCGYGVPFSTITEREGFAVNAQGLQALTAQIATGKPAEKLRGLELLAGLVEQFKAQAQSNPQAATLVSSFTDALNKSQVDPSKAVATWGSFLTAVQSAERRPVIMEKFLTDENPERRILGLLVANSLPPDQQIARAKKLIDLEKEESVRSYAQAMVEIAEVAIASKGVPATAPATAPSPAPAVQP